MTITTWRNLLLGAGAYFLSRLAAVPVAALMHALTRAVDDRGDASGALLSPVVQYLPEAIAASAAGALVALLVNSDQPVKWSLVPAFFYVLDAYTSAVIFRPSVGAYFGVAIGALLPAITCVAAARLISWHRGLR
jgi:hypothetical protein